MQIGVNHGQTQQLARAIRLRRSYFTRRFWIRFSLPIDQGLAACRSRNLRPTHRRMTLHTQTPAARDGLATGWTVSSIGDKPCKGLPSLQRALTSAEDSGAPPVSVSIAPPSVIINIGEKARRKLQKRGNAAAKKLRATSNAGGGGTDVTTEFYRLAVCLSPSPHHTCTLRCQTKPRLR